MKPAGGLAVMASRREPPDSLEFFPTPPWATRALCEHVLPHLGLAKAMEHCACWDPACGEGHMAEVLFEYFNGGWGSDIFDYGRGYRVEDFLNEETVIGSPEDGMAPEFIITNPPFRPAAAFALRAMTLAPVVALLLRTAWIEGVERYETLFRDRPPTLYAPFVERVPMTKGRWDPKASTATSYAWFVWVRGRDPLPVFWIPPGCRQALTKAGDVERFGVRTPAPLFEVA
ncbi:hypothetical protein [Methylobacterium aquaticum]|uniref:Methyltransferase n=1 Tax=Methylobacterium aquaticum TaxID=270351 RepID=A0A0C6FC04_9HYPH|nr:hypothetical protein [Methylobacterium aquaticum]BAQ44372.1 hypothetical protein Maq22A_c04830 [Methylobacterium aquaticum]